MVPLMSVTIKGTPEICVGNINKGNYSKVLEQIDNTNSIHVRDE